MVCKMPPFGDGRAFSFALPLSYQIFITEYEYETIERRSRPKGIFSIPNFILSC